ncbi:MAG TPA: protein TolR [Candidatus Megaira endosymbiont of Nemacystus decipiens]|nr:protein TolR [Candidatus Megaera endosymbiont of Nemacystus decipiens]
MNYGNLALKRQRRNKFKQDINVTPIVDVMLVLLIIFMITSPMILAGIDVDLPQTKSAPTISSNKPLVISVDKKGDIYLFETKIPKNELINKLQEVTKENKEAKIFVKGDKSVNYGTVVKLISQVKNAGFKGVALVSDIEN